MHGSEFACRCTHFPVMFVFINPTFCVGSGLRLFQDRFCAYAWTLLHKDEFSFENENQPVCSSVSSRLNVSSIFMSSLSSLINTIFVCVSVFSCLTLNVSSIFMSSLSSLINTIFITVSCGSQSLQQEFICVFGHFVLFKMRIMNRKKVINPN